MFALGKVGRLRGPGNSGPRVSQEGDWAMGGANGQSQWTDKQVFTTGEAAEICKVSQQTIIRCFDSGRLQGFRVPGSRFRRIPRPELLKFMHENDIPTDSLETTTRRLLVVDDDPQIIELFRDILGHDDRFDVKCASTGYDAGLLTEQHKPHLVLLDYMLPDINGNQVCKRLRETPGLESTKVLLISGVVKKEDIGKLLEDGADEFMKKPFDVDTLMETIEGLLGL